MKRLLRNLLPVLSLIFLCGIGQSKPSLLPSRHPKGEKFDPLPDFLSDVHGRVCEILNCSEADRGGRGIDTVHGKIAYNLSFCLSTDEHCDSTGLRRCGDTWVLAWQQWQATNMYKIVDSSLFLEHHILVLYHKQRDSGAAPDEWKLLYLLKFENSRWMRERIVSASNVHSISWLTFSSKPTNDDIYNAVRKWNEDPKVLFGFDLKRNGTGKGTKTFKGIEFELANGQVYKKTWETVIGEKPTKFFPNGK